MYAELSLCCPLQPGMVTHESRGNETAVAFRPSAGMCTRIIVSVELVTCSVVDSSLSSAGVALVRSSLPTSRMLVSRPSTSSWVAPIALTRSTFVLKSR